MSRRAALITSLVAVLVVGIGVYALVSSNDPPGAAPSPTGTSSASAPPASTSTEPGPSVATSAAPGPPPITVDSGPITLTVAPNVDTPTGEGAPSEATVVPPDTDGMQELLLRVGAQPLRITLTSPGAFVRALDGSVTVEGDDGTPLGGFSAPTAANGEALATVVVTDTGHIDVSRTADQAAASTTAEVSLLLGSNAVRAATWGVQEGGRSLAVSPTTWTRRAGAAGVATAWVQLIAAEPSANTPGMRDQLTCHAIGAPDKTTWNLEPWRPDVGLLKVMAAGCNPT